jgi:exopolysaccharide biosynthesis protein
MKRILKLTGKIFSFIFLTILFLFLNIILMFNMFCNGPSLRARRLFATTLLETGQMKFIVNYFIPKEEIIAIVNENSLKEMSSEVDTELIHVNKEDNETFIKIEKVSGNNFAGTMMIIKDPTKISLATTYPWTEYGKELSTLVKENNAIAGINGGLYASLGNKGGKPLGVAVSNGEILEADGGYAGLHIIGFDNQNILRIIDISSMGSNDIKKVIQTEGIRDAVAFQEEISDKNNHFVKLIINGETRELKGLGSGANPRTAIGQRADGTVLFLVTDGRGANGHLGATASDLIHVMQKYNAVNAANIDGGSSSSMYYQDKYLMTSVTLYYSNTSWRLPTAFVVAGE